MTNCGQAAADGSSAIGTWMAGSAKFPNTISHNREREILNMNGFEPCDELKKAIDQLKETIKWRKSDLNPAHKGTRIYVNHQTYIKKLNSHRENLERKYSQYCQNICVDGLSLDNNSDSRSDLW